MREMNARKYDDLSLPYRAHVKQQMQAPFLLLCLVCALGFCFFCTFSAVPLKICREILTMPLILV